MRITALLVLPLGLSLAASALAQTMSSPAPMSSGMGSMDDKSMGSGSQATVKLVPENGSNETGTVTLTQTNMGVLVTVSTDTAPDSPQPAHIHKGSCAKLDPAPAFPLTPVAKSANSMGNPKGASTTTVKGITLAQLESGDYAINVHKSATEAKIYVACGDIKNANPTGTSQ